MGVRQRRNLDNDYGVERPVDLRGQYVISNKKGTFVPWVEVENVSRRRMAIFDSLPRVVRDYVNEYGRLPIWYETEFFFRYPELMP
jgi:hypothetical protein